MGLRDIVKRLPHLKNIYYAEIGKPSANHEQLRQIYECWGVGEHASVNVKVLKPLLTARTPPEYAERWFGKIALTTSLTSIHHLLPEPGLYSHAIDYSRRRRGENPQNLDVSINTEKLTGHLRFKTWEGYFAIGAPAKSVKTDLYCKNTEILEPMILPYPYSPQRSVLTKIVMALSQWLAGSHPRPLPKVSY